MISVNIPLILIETDNFRNLLVNRDGLVDKASLLKGFLEDSGKVMLITGLRVWPSNLNLKDKENVKK